MLERGELKRWIDFTNPNGAALLMRVTRELAPKYHYAVYHWNALSFEKRSLIGQELGPVEDFFLYDHHLRLATERKDLDLESDLKDWEDYHELMSLGGRPACSVVELQDMFREEPGPLASAFIEAWSEPAVPLEIQGSLATLQLRDWERFLEWQKNNRELDEEEEDYQKFANKIRSEKSYNVWCDKLVAAPGTNLSGFDDASVENDIKRKWEQAQHARRVKRESNRERHWYGFDSYVATVADRLKKHNPNIIVKLVSNPGIVDSRTNDSNKRIGKDHFERLRKDEEECLFEFGPSGSSGPGYTPFSLSNTNYYQGARFNPHAAPKIATLFRTQKKEGIETNEGTSSSCLPNPDKKHAVGSTSNQGIRQSCFNFSPPNKKGPSASSVPSWAGSGGVSDNDHRISSPKKNSGASEPMRGRSPCNLFADHHKAPSAEAKTSQATGGSLFGQGSKKVANIPRRGLDTPVYPTPNYMSPLGESSANDARVVVYLEQDPKKQHMLGTWIEYLNLALWRYQQAPDHKRAQIWIIVKWIEDQIPHVQLNQPSTMPNEEFWHKVQESLQEM